MFTSIRVIAGADSSSTVDWWPMINHDLAHTGYSTSTAPTTNQTLWVFTTGGAVETSPAVVNGIVYIGSDDGFVYALNAENGALIWKYSTGGPVQSSPAVLNGVVYIGGFHSHAVFALNASTGALIWSSPTNSVYPNQISSTAVANGLVYVDVYDTGNGGELYAFNASNGNLAWKYTPPAWLSSSPAVYGGKVYLATTAGVVVAFNATSGQTSWTYSETNAILSCSLSTGDGLVYVGAPGEMAEALNASTGKYVWSGYIVGGVDASCPAIAKGVLYVSTTYGGTEGSVQPGGITALDATTGTKLWNTTIGSILEIPTMAPFAILSKKVIHQNKD
jgi:outer membrane protein assembly factor BamB